MTTYLDLGGFGPHVAVLETIAEMPRGRPAYGLARLLHDRYPDLSVSQWGRVVRAAVLMELVDYTGERVGRRYWLNTHGKAYLERLHEEERQRRQARSKSVA
jgi:hypothetical protein